MQKQNQQLRTHCVSVRLNDLEMASLDKARGGHTRGSYLRDCWLDSKPASPIPALNRQAWIELSRAASNLNQLAHSQNKGDLPDLTDIALMLMNFRAALITAKP